jgi:hypothetical protein
MSRLTFSLMASATLMAGAVACSPAEPEPAPEPETRTVVQEVPVVVEREAPPPVVVEREAGDSTTVRAGPDGIEVETTNR